MEPDIIFDIESYDTLLASFHDNNDTYNFEEFYNDASSLVRSNTLPEHVVAVIIEHSYNSATSKEVALSHFRRDVALANKLLRRIRNNLS